MRDTEMTTIENLRLDCYELWSDLTDSLGSVDELRAELARRADQGDEVAALHRSMFGPWEEEIVSADEGDKVCANCIYCSQRCVCLASCDNLVFGTRESPNVGQEVELTDSCEVWYEGEIGLDAMDCTPDPWRPASLI